MQIYLHRDGGVCNSYWRFKAWEGFEASSFPRSKRAMERTKGRWKGQQLLFCERSCGPMDLLALRQVSTDTTVYSDADTLHLLTFPE